MSVDPSAERPEQLDEELTDALVASCRLSQEQVARIMAMMGERKLNFVDAALQLDLITPKEAAEALEWARQSVLRSHSSLVEKAIRRQSDGRIATVRHTVHVKPGNNLLLVHDPDNPHCERLRALRTELLLLLDTGSRKSNLVALLSPCPGEGRSLLTAELAIAFSQLGRRTLLIDADLRRPRQHVLFGADNAWGLAQFLAFNEAPQPLGVEGLPHLSLLPSGQVPPNPLELLSDGRFERMLSDCRNHYDFAFIDTPAVTQFADGLAIASFAERVLLVSRANATSYSDMKELLRRLASTRSHVLGAVINSF